MNRTLIELTARQLLGRRRLLLIALLALVPVAVALLYRLSDAPEDTAPDRFFVNLMQGFVLPVILPIAALVLGTVALGAEIDDGTIVYLLAKPIPRWRIIAAKLLVAAGATLALMLPMVIATALVVFGGAPADGLLLGFAVGLAAGAVAYCAVFLALAALTGRALVIGMAYVFVWEATVTSVLGGTRILSVRYHVLAIAETLASAPPAVFDPPLGATEAIVATVAAFAVALLVAVYKLDRFELGERL